MKYTLDRYVVAGALALAGMTTALAGIRTAPPRYESLESRLAHRPDQRAERHMATSSAIGATLTIAGMLTAARRYE